MKQKMESAKQRVMEKLGSQEQVSEVQESWTKLKTKRGERDWEKANGIILNLIDVGLSEIEIRSILPVGSSRIQRLRSYDPSVAPISSGAPLHALNRKDIAFFKGFIEGIDTEDGFPCGHRRPKKYVLEEGATWKKLYARYIEQASKEPSAAEDDGVLDIPAVSYSPISWSASIKGESI
jgi:hypothetical protein